MISIGLLGAGIRVADYYLNRDAGCRLEYYLEREPIGLWLGTGTVELGLVGGLDERGEQRLRALLSGADLDGRRLVPAVLRADPRSRLAAGPVLTAVAGRASELGITVDTLIGKPQLIDEVTRLRGLPRATVSVGVAGDLAAAAGLDPHLVYRAKNGVDRYGKALTHQDARVDVRRAGIDVTVSAPKSVSVLFALSSAEVVAEVRAAHTTAVGQALDFLEQVAGHGLRGHQGDGRRARRIGTDGFIAAAFEHHTSRAGDPQLHTHLVIANLLHGVDDQWSALDSRAIHRHATTASYVYQAVLRGELTSRLGVDWTSPVKGIAEIAGVPTELRRLFSTRRGQIETELARLGRTDAAAAQQACLSTRPVKPTSDQADLRRRWTDQAAATGHNPADVVSQTLHRRGAPEAVRLETLAERLFSPDGLTRHASAFTADDALRKICELLPIGAMVTGPELRSWTRTLLRHPEVIRLRPAGPEPIFTTRDLLRVEAAALGLAGGLSQTTFTTHDRVTSVPPNSQPQEQPELLQRLLAEPKQLTVITGPAGAGKTSALAAAATAWREAAIPAYGAALAAAAARNLQQATGITSTSLTRLFHDLDRLDPVTGRPAGLAAGSVLVVDEASMVGTRQLARLLDHVQQANARLVLLGDPRQLPEIEAGGLFAELAQALDPNPLTTNRRQEHAWERDALAALRSGRITEAIDAYLAHDRVHAAPDSTHLTERVVRDYLLQHWQAANPADVAILTVRRGEAARLNALVRAQLTTIGALRGPAATIVAGDHEREFLVGDLVVATRNDYRTGLLNGTRATVRQIEPDRVTLATADGRILSLSMDELKHCRPDHGYAMTVHKAQGSTLEVALLYGSAALTREAGYVGLSRGRQENHVYTLLTPERTQDCIAGPQAEEIDEPDVRRTLLNQLRRQRAQRLARSRLPDRSPRQSPTPRREPYRHRGIGR